MDIGIITHYDVHNHGALLQLNALCKVLKKMGYEATALRFEKNYDFLGIELKDKYNISLRSIPYYCTYLAQKGLGRTWYNVQKKRILDKFKIQEGIVGEYYTQYKSMKAVIIGSDEIFALHTGPTPVFWGYALPSDNVFAYAGCFGPTTITDIQAKHCESFVRGGLENLTALSVRDRNSHDIIEKLIGQDVEIVCDPVLLYGYKDELQTLPKVVQKPYLLVYAYDNNMNNIQEVQAIKKYAKARGLQIVSPGFYHDWCDKNINVDPVTLLSYFRDAQCVVTDTFHGSVMSILVNAELAVILRNNSNKLGYLLEEYTLSKRIISEDRGLNELFSEEIDWEKVNAHLLKKRESSMAYLTNCLSK